MNLHNLKQDYPKMPVEIKNMISSEVENHLSEKGGKKFKKYKSIVAAAAIILLAGTTVYAADKLIEIYSTKTGNYAYETEIVNNSNEKPTTQDATETYITVNYNYLPKNLETWNSYIIDPDDMHPFYYANFQFFELPEAGTSYKENYTNVTLQEEQIINNMTAIYTERKYSDASETMYRYDVICEEYNLLIRMIFYDNLDREDAVKIIENMSFATTDNENAENIIYIGALTPGPGTTEPEIITNATNPDYVHSVTKEEMQDFHSIGETFSINLTANQQQVTVDVCVTDVKVYDNINQLPEGFKDVLTYIYGENIDIIDENGSFLPNTLYFMKNGDGVNTLDEILETRVTDTKLVCVEIDYTNPNENAIAELLYQCELYSLINTGDVYEVSQFALLKEVHDTDYLNADVCSPTLSSSMFYNDIDATQKNHITVIQPGETKTVYCLFHVQEDELDTMYIDLQDTVGATEICKDNLSVSFVDISQ